jgi:hypothetical protein
MRPYAFAILLLPVVLAACGSDDRDVVLVQPKPESRVVVLQPPPAPAEQPVVVTPPPTYATAIHTAVVKSYGGNVHMLPDSRSTIVTTLPAGAKVSVIGSTDWGTWDHVVANGVDGYMPHSELTSL